MSLKDYNVFLDWVSVDFVSLAASLKLVTHLDDFSFHFVPVHFVVFLVVNTSFIFKTLQSYGFFLTYTNIYITFLLYITFFFILSFFDHFWRIFRTKWSKTRHFFIKGNPPKISLPFPLSRQKQTPPNFSAQWCHHNTNLMKLLLYLLPSLHFLNCILHKVGVHACTHNPRVDAHLVMAHHPCYLCIEAKAHIIRRTVYLS